MNISRSSVGHGDRTHTARSTRVAAIRVSSGPFVFDVGAPVRVALRCARHTCAFGFSAFSPRQ